MANKRLTLAQVDQMKDMVLKGITPEDIADHFGIAISSVHNYKQRFRAEGLQYPSVKGKRPVGSVDMPEQKITYTLPMQENRLRAEIQGETLKVVTGAAYNFIVNGVNVQIQGDVKNVNISKDHIEVNF